MDSLHGPKQKRRRLDPQLAQSPTISYNALCAPPPTAHPLLRRPPMDNKASLHLTGTLIRSAAQQYRRRARTTLEDFVLSYFPYQGLPLPEVMAHHLPLLAGHVTQLGHGGHSVVSQHRVRLRICARLCRS